MLKRKTAEDRQAEQERRAQNKQRLADQRATEREAIRQAREQQSRERAERAAERRQRLAATTGLQWLGVTVRDGEVYKYSFAMIAGREAPGPPLGFLAGAHAEIVGGRAGHRRSGGARAADAALATSVLGPVGLAAGLSRKGTKGTAFVVFANGALHEKALNDDTSIVRAQADAVRFNALAARAQRPDVPFDATPPSPMSPGSDSGPKTGPAADGGGSAGQRSEHIADQLAKLAGLHAAGSLTSAEYQAAKNKLLDL
jgi:Short C-terminal domain